MVLILAKFIYRVLASLNDLGESWKTRAASVYKFIYTHFRSEVLTESSPQARDKLKTAMRKAGLVRGREKMEFRKRKNEVFRGSVNKCISGDM